MKLQGPGAEFSDDKSEKALVNVSLATDIRLR